MKICSPKPLLDSFMIMLFLLLMADRYTGNGVHEYLGLVLIGSFLFHVGLNRHWLKTLLKGRYTFLRFLRLVTILLLSLSVLGTVGSAIVISNSVFSFFDLQGGLFSRRLHVFFAHWSFIFAAAHLGLHEKKLSTIFNWNKFLSCSNRIFLVVTNSILVYGAYTFIQRELVYPLTMSSTFMIWNNDENIFIFLLDYIAIFFLFSRVANTLSNIKYNIKNFSLHTSEV